MSLFAVNLSIRNRFFILSLRVGSWFSRGSDTFMVNLNAKFCLGVQLREGVQSQGGPGGSGPLQPRQQVTTHISATHKTNAYRCHARKDIQHFLYLRVIFICIILPTKLYRQSIYI